jgi:AcrR family transcriptional regulator
MPKIVDHDRQREVLLDACFRLFVEDGYADATMRKLAKAAGVSTGMLYHYFPDKQALLGGLFELLLRRDVARVRGELPLDAPVPVRIRALFRFYGANQRYLRDLLRLALEVHRHEPSAASREQVVDAVRHYRAAVADVLHVDGDLLDMAFGFLVGGLAHGLLDPEAVDVDAHEAFAQIVWAKLGPMWTGPHEPSADG